TVADDCPVIGLRDPDEIPPPTLGDEGTETHPPTLEANPVSVTKWVRCIRLESIFSPERFSRSPEEASPCSLDWVVGVSATAERWCCSGWPPSSWPVAPATSWAPPTPRSSVSRQASRAS